MTPTNEDFDAPAYTRDETSLPEIQRRLALWEPTGKRRETVLSTRSFGPPWTARPAAW